MLRFGLPTVVKVTLKKTLRKEEDDQKVLKKQKIVT